MTCVEAQPLLQAYFDRELEIGAALDIEQHLASCPRCIAEYKKFELVRSEITAAGLNFATDEMLQRIRPKLGGNAHASPFSGDDPKTPVLSQGMRSWRFPVLLAAAAALVVAFFLPGRFAPGRATLDRELVDSHMRSLLGNHLIDIPSSDRHTVKPWFQGRIDFAPQVPDLSSIGFVLAGGRLDIIDGHKAAALVYKRGEHIINLWLAPGSEEPTEPKVTEVGGFRLIRWSKEGMTYRAVSDADAADLRTFANAIRTW